MDRSSDDGSGYETPTSVPAKKAKRKYNQKYSKLWESEEEFKKWLQESSRGSSFAFCTSCNVHLTLKAGRSDLRKHAVSKKHTENSISLRKQPSLLDMASTSKKQKQNESVKASEIRLATFIAEHDLPLSVVDHMPKLMQAVCPDSEIAKHIKCGRTKVTAIMNKVTGEESFSQLIEALKVNNFSLIVDESTDKGCVKHMCVVARTLLDREIKDCFLALIPVKDGSTTALHTSLINFLNKYEIPYKDNWIWRRWCQYNAWRSSFSVITTKRGSSSFVYNEMYMPLIRALCIIRMFEITKRH